MKIQLKELRALIAAEINEAKKKKTKKEKDAERLQPKGYQKDPMMDFSEPQGANNLYKRQGVSNFGPYTSEGALRLFVRECVREGLSQVVSEKHIGFKKLKEMLTKENATALAASIGKEKYRTAGMTRKVAAGKKKK